MNRKLSENRQISSKPRIYMLTEHLEEDRRRYHYPISNHRFFASQGPQGRRWDTLNWWNFGSTGQERCSWRLRGDRRLTFSAEDPW